MCIALPAEKTSFTFADYLTWNENEHVELIDGEAVMMAPPSTVHQLISMELSRQLANFLEGKKCRAILAPFAVRPLETEKRDALDHIVIEHHHQAIIDYRTFATAKALRESRSTNSYRGQKKYDNSYSGFLECGDCGSPMFAMSQKDKAEACRCGTYHRRGVKGCTSHHIRVDKLDELLKLYVQKNKANSASMLERLNADLSRESEDIAETEKSAENLEAILSDLQEELKATKRQRIRDLMKHPDQEATLEETYDELESDLLHRIEGIQTQLALTENKRSTIIQVNRVAKTALDVFDDILNKPKLDRNDLQLIIQKIKVYGDHLEILLKADIDSILRSGELPGELELIQSATRRPDKIFYSNVISDGDPLLTKLEPWERFCGGMMGLEKRMGWAST